jgi:hypothetical protein
MILEDAKVFNVEMTVKEDVTAFGNRFYFQIEDSRDEDNSWLRIIKDKRFVVTCIAVELNQSFVASRYETTT